MKLALMHFPRKNSLAQSMGETIVLSFKDCKGGLSGLVLIEVIEKL